MPKFIILIGLLFILAGVTPLPKYEPKKVELRIHQVYHERCVITDKEM